MPRKPRRLPSAIAERKSKTTIDWYIKNRGDYIDLEFRKKAVTTAKYFFEKRMAALKTEKAGKKTGKKVPPKSLTRNVMRRVTNPVKVTPAIKAYVARFKPTAEGVRLLVESLYNDIKLEIVRPSYAQFMYGKQTAHDIITSKKIPVASEVGKKRVPAWGCRALSVVLFTCLKAMRAKHPKKIKNIKHIRTRTIAYAPHSLIYVEVEGRKYLLDLFKGGKVSLVGEEYFAEQARGGKGISPRMVQIGSTLQTQIKELKKEGFWRVEPLTSRYPYTRYVAEFKK